MKLVSLENLSKYNKLLNQKTVRSVNSVKPDSNGNVTLGTEKSTFNKVVYDTGYFSIGTEKTYNFDLTGTELENVSKENVNIRLVAKVVTAHKGYEVGDIIPLSTGLDIPPDWMELGVSTFIRGNTLYIYSGRNTCISIKNETFNWLEKPNVQIKAVLTAFVPDDGSILLIAEDQTNTSKLIGLPDGTLTWKDKNLIRSVNGVNADENGNVEITTSGADLSGVVKSVNNIQPDESGNLTLEIPSTDGMVKSINSVKPDSNGNVTLGTEKSTFNKVVYDTGYFSIGTNATYKFDLTGTDLENVSKENVNIQLVAKVVTAHYGFEVGDIAQLTPTLDANADYDELDICSYIHGNTLCVYSGHNTAFSINNGTGWIRKPNVQIKAVLTAFVPDDGSILLIAEDQTNTSKLIGLPDGTLTWKDKNLVRSVNNVTADENGNVEITTSGADLSGVVKSVNGIQPDESGNISLNVFTTPGNIIKWETDFFDIAPSGLYSFDLSNTPFANIPREAINIQMVGKVKTAQNGFKVDDYAYPQFANYFANGGTEIGSTPYISGNVLSIRFGDSSYFVIASPNGPKTGLAKTNVKVKLILTALIKEV